MLKNIGPIIENIVSDILPFVAGSIIVKKLAKAMVNVTITVATTALFFSFINFKWLFLFQFYF